MNGFIYKNDTLDYFVFEDGIINFREIGFDSEGYETPYRFEYHIKDHLGNTRVVITPDAQNNCVTLQKNTYYPFGLTVSNNIEKNKYLYNGKELQDEFGLWWYDYGARFYDPAIARFSTLDPLAENFSHQSPFVYADNNPIRFIDFMGMNADVYIYGPDADRATEELNYTSSLNISRDSETGKLSATGEATTDADKKLQKAINDKGVKVNLTTTKDNSYVAKDDGKTYNMVIGAYDGSEVKTASDGSQTVVTDQKINIDHTKKDEAGGGMTVGQSVLHETLESYIGAKDDPGGNYNTGYHSAHSKAAALDPNFKSGGSMYINKNNRTGKVEYGIEYNGQRIKLYEE